MKFATKEEKNKMLLMVDKIPSTKFKCRPIQKGSTSCDKATTNFTSNCTTNTKLFFLSINQLLLVISLLITTAATFTTNNNSIATLASAATPGLATTAITNRPNANNNYNHQDNNNNNKTKNNIEKVDVVSAAASTTTQISIASIAKVLKVRSQSNDYSEPNGAGTDSGSIVSGNDDGGGVNTGGNFGVVATTTSNASNTNNKNDDDDDNLNNTTILIEYDQQQGYYNNYNDNNATPKTTAVSPITTTPLSLQSTGQRGDEKSTLNHDDVDRNGMSTSPRTTATTIEPALVSIADNDTIVVFDSSSSLARSPTPLSGVSVPAEGKELARDGFRLFDNNMKLTERLVGKDQQQQRHRLHSQTLPGKLVASDYASASREKSQDKENPGQLLGIESEQQFVKATLPESSSNIINNNNNNNDYIVDEGKQQRKRITTFDNVKNNKNQDNISVKNASGAFEILFRKKPFSKYWSAEQKWDDIFRRFIEIQGQLKNNVAKSFLKDIEYYSDVAISQKCHDDLKYVQDYVKSKSKNVRWLMHMADSMGKSESGMLTGNMANMGHVIQCIKTRAPARLSNDSYDERYFEQQALDLGERFRGKYCLASVRPVLPEKPYLISRFSDLFNITLLSNISFTGETNERLKIRSRDYTIPREISKKNQQNEFLDFDEIPFESELYGYLISQRNFMFTLPRFLGVCYPSTCSSDDIKSILQHMNNEQHQVIDIEFDCEVEEHSAWDWFSMPRLMAYVLFSLIVFITFFASLTRYILVDKLHLKGKLKKGSNLDNLMNLLDLLSMDKCAGILFIKTKPASPIIDRSKLENERSTSIDALKGFLILVLVYSQLIHLGCLPVPFMWSKWVDAMFPFYRSPWTQIFLNTTIWSEAFYIISAYLITVKLLEKHRPKLMTSKNGTIDEKDYQELTRDQNDKSYLFSSPTLPSFSGYVLKRYIRIILPTIGVILMNYIWPRFTNGFVWTDQVNKILKPCDSYGWTNLLLVHNHHEINETCLWPTFVGASFFQLHIISYPILIILLYSIRTSIDSVGTRRLINIFLTCTGLLLILALALIGLIYPALKAVENNLIVPFLIDYIDYDNYRRVIEWTVMPTYNHITSYMIGILLGYFVVKIKLSDEIEMFESIQYNNSNDQIAYIHREPSFESITTSSSTTQEFNHNNKLSTFSHIDMNSDYIRDESSRHNQRLKNLTTDEYVTSIKFEKEINSFSKWVARGSGFIYSVLLLMTCFLSLLASSYWNSLGNPMSSNQTFWYIILTKLVFNVTFGLLFFKFFALRKNCINPWMLTRFLVPIGRMSLTVFYTSWLVIWFDLLSSLYQWHPSHYFIFEKFNEIVFMLLIISMFAYGTFEGSVKRVQYNRRAELRKRKTKSSQSKCNLNSSLDNFDCQNSLATGFHSMFLPPFDAKMESDTNKKELQQDSSSKEQSQKVFNGNKMFTKNSNNEQQHANPKDNSQQCPSPRPAYLSSLQANNYGRSITKPSLYKLNRQHSSIADQYKLNAELRANYSFASIGLFESAGASDDLRFSTPSSPTPSNDNKNERKN